MGRLNFSSELLAQIKLNLKIVAEAPNCLGKDFGGKRKYIEFISSMHRVIDHKSS